MTDSIDEYAEEIRDGLNQFLEHTEPDVDVLRKDELETGKTRVIFGFTVDESELPAELDPCYSYTFQEGGDEFTFGVEDNQFLIIETALEDLGAIDLEEHTGEAIGCLLDSRQKS